MRVVSRVGNIEIATQKTTSRKLVNNIYSQEKIVNKIGQVKSTYGTAYDVFWNSSSGEIRVASELAGYAKTEREAMSKADFYATTGQVRKD